MRRLEFMGSAGIVALVLIAGCEESSRKFTSVSNTISGGRPAEAPSPPEHSKAPGDSTRLATAGRKIIHNAHVDLVTENLNKLEELLAKLIEANKAYVADSDRTGSSGSTRHGSWKVRVPADLYDPFVQGAQKLGELVSFKTDTQDVSEEFFDLEAREAAKKVEETRLLKHLTESTGKLDEILAVERELSRVRSEIERMEGRLRVLANLTTLATVTITASEIKDYVPPRAPTLGTRLARTFASSLESLQHSGETLLIVIVALAPWLPLVAIGVVVFIRIARRISVRLPAAFEVEPTGQPGRRV